MRSPISLPLLKSLKNLFFYLPVLKFTVADKSMLEALRPGDQVLVARFVYVHKGQIVVARVGNHYVIKRVAKVKNGVAELSSDNPEADPKEWLIPRREIVGVVFFVQKYDEED